MLHSHLPGKRTQVANLKVQIIVAISDDSSTSLEKVLIIIKDLEDIFRRLAESEELGIAWNSDNFNCTRVDWDNWRERLLFRKKILEKKAKRVADEEKAENDVYLKNLKARSLPKIIQKKTGRSSYQPGT